MPYSTDVENVGLSFVKEYYGMLSENPAVLSTMYGRESSMVTESGDVIEGAEAIKNHLSNKSVEERKFRISNLGSYGSVTDSVLVIVQGTILTRTSSIGFRQTFVLGATPKEGVYYVHNDILTLEESSPLAAPVEAAPVVPEPVPEPEPVKAPTPVQKPVEPEVEVVAEPEPVPEPVPEPEPVKEATPVQKPVEPKVEAKPEPVPEVKRTGWAAIAAKKSADAPAAVQQVVRGGTVPGAIGVQKKPVEEEKKRDLKPRGPRPEKTESFTLYVSGIPKEYSPATLETDIDTLFTKFGQVRSKTVKQGFCFVDFAEKAGAEKALAAGAEGQISLGGEKLKVQRKEEKPRAANGAAPARK